MNKDVAIRVEGLGKRYALGQQLNLTRTFRETLVTIPRLISQKARRSFGRFIAPSASSTLADPETPAGSFWALRDVSFEIKQGEVMGVIGRNGAGKSTLLKILSRITSPTKGNAQIYGRVGSLLEVGTGFHPELTGRENIYLNGAILGMKRKEIDRKFDEIVAFAEVERFLDTPVKRYSSGMGVRLAFAVAAHLEPEILVIDEVLAVGDAAFQKRCLGKMEDITRGGRTVLFVSHNMGAVNELCDRCVLLEAGRVAEIGATATVVQKYLSTMEMSSSDVSLEPRSCARVAFRRIWTSTIDGQATGNIDVTQPFKINMLILVRETVNDVEVSVQIRNVRGNPVFFTNLSDSRKGEITSLAEGEYSCSFEVPQHFLVPDTYKVHAVTRNPVSDEDTRADVISFTVAETGSIMRRFSEPWRLGCVLLELPWDYEKLNCS